MPKKARIDIQFCTVLKGVATRTHPFCFIFAAESIHRGLKVPGSKSKKELVKVLQEAMRQEEEQNGGKPLKTCRSDECQCVRDGEHLVLPLFLKYSCVKNSQTGTSDTFVLFFIGNLGGHQESIEL